jgi:hypothetical protein
MSIPRSTTMPVMSSSADIFASTATQCNYESCEYQKYLPITPVDYNTRVIEFTIPGNSEKYTYLSKGYLKLKMKITKQSGANTEATSIVIPVYILCNSIRS